jgi:tRNA-specific 2-thiouridylase
MPLGKLSKAEVRQIAAEAGLSVAQKQDSQEICFVTEGSYTDYIEADPALQSPGAGNFVSEDGKILGRHQGIIHYTVGQRRGLGLSSKERLYVRSIDPDNNTVVLGDDRSLFSKELTAWDFNWISGSPPEGKLKCSAKIRYRHREQSATAEVLADGLVHIVFDDLQREITPGQSVVLYNGDEVLGGGIIQRR